MSNEIHGILLPMTKIQNIFVDTLENQNKWERTALQIIKRRTDQAGPKARQIAS